MATSLSIMRIPVYLNNQAKAGKLKVRGVYTSICKVVWLLIGIVVDMCSIQISWCLQAQKIDRKNNKMLIHHWTFHISITKQFLDNPRPEVVYIALYSHWWDNWQTITWYKIPLVLLAFELMKLGSYEQFNAMVTQQVVWFLDSYSIQELDLIAK